MKMRNLEVRTGQRLHAQVVLRINTSFSCDFPVDLAPMRDAHRARKQGEEGPMLQAHALLSVLAKSNCQIPCQDRLG